MINNFSYFLYDNNLNDYLNCYSTFLMTNKALKTNILNHRMNFLINYYIQENNNKIKKYKLIEYYIRSYKDEYLKKTIDDKNLNYDKNGNDDKNVNPNEEEKRDDDIEDHYKNMFINPPPKPEIDYDEIDRIYVLNLEKEEREKEREKEIILENEYDENYDSYDIYENYDDNDDYENNSDDDYFEINKDYY